jgi:hypothetical protein
MISLVMKGEPFVDAQDLILMSMIAPFYAVSEDTQGIGFQSFITKKTWHQAKTSR